VDQLERARERQHRARLETDRLGGGEREHRPDALASGQQRVAHRLLQARRKSLLGEAHVLEVALHLRAQMVRI
jgi:hypothetical protein